MAQQRFTLYDKDIFHQRKFITKLPSGETRKYSKSINYIGRGERGETQFPYFNAKVYGGINNMLAGLNDGTINNNETLPWLVGHFYNVEKIVKILPVKEGKPPRYECILDNSYQQGGSMKSNSWLKFVKLYQQKNPSLSYKEVLQEASEPYKKFKKTYSK